MKLTTLTAIALAALLVTAGAAAAVPGGLPADAADDDHERASDHDDEQADDAGEDAAQADDEAEDAEANASVAAGAHTADGPGHAAAQGQQGPPTDMPEPVPDHVVEVHQLVLDFLSGDLDGDLGSAVSDVTPNDGDDGSAEASA